MACGLHVLSAGTVLSAPEAGAHLDSEFLGEYACLCALCVCLWGLHMHSTGWSVCVYVRVCVFWELK